MSEDAITYGNDWTPERMSEHPSIWLIKNPQGTFMPFNDFDYDKAKKFKIGEPNLFKYQSVRNAQLHRKYFAMINLAYENQDEYNDRYIFRKLIEMRAGYYEYVKTDKGEMWWPKSISYEKLNQEDFADLYDKVWAVLQEKYGFDETFENELAKFA